VVAEDILLSLVGLKIQVTPHEYLEEDEETKIKGLFEDVTDFKGDEIYRPFISKKQFVTKLEENHIFISTHRLTKHMVRWGYSKEDRNRRGDRGWLNIQFVNSMLDGSGDF
jgi:hypothetical protein